MSDMHAATVAPSGALLASSASPASPRSSGVEVRGLRSFAEKRGFTIHDLAAACGLPYPVVAAWWGHDGSGWGTGLPAVAATRPDERAALRMFRVLSGAGLMPEAERDAFADWCGLTRDRIDSADVAARVGENRGGG